RTATIAVQQVLDTTGLFTGTIHWLIPSLDGISPPAVVGPTLTANGAFQDIIDLTIGSDDGTVLNTDVALETVVLPTPEPGTLLMLASAIGLVIARLATARVARAGTR